ncbi:uncharacterized protein LOC117642850 [Thrips palmi]|uniref:Uncharacterized protein LOC117642850 n=1 Tax=Thrips palmi TaxID=161013 RepID=A0A6P8YTE3_THRPL|nr:uncharacterized protein LOC117642850 [Thrips palmi]
MDPVTLVCRFCTSQFSNVSAYFSHLKLHRHITAIFPCCITSCRDVFKSEINLRTHLYRHHSLDVRLSKDNPNRSQLVSNAFGKFECTLLVCKKELDSFKELSKHLKGHMNSGATTPCPFPDCNRVFKCSNNFGVHVSRSHRAGTLSRVVPDVPDVPDVVPDVVEAVLNVDNCDSLDDLPIVDGPLPPVAELVDEGKLLLDNLAQFFMKLEFQYLLPASTVLYIAKELQTLHEDTFNAISDKLRKKLSRENISPETTEMIVNEVFDVHRKHLKALRTEYTRNKYYLDNFLYVNPRKKRLKNGNFFYYVSIIKTLKRIFKSKSYSVSLDPPSQSDPNVLKDFTDGKCYKDNPFFKDNEKSIKLILYQDAFELVHAIGPAKGKHKTIGIYLTIGNMPDYMRSKVNNIFLIGLCKEKDYDHEKLFRPIIDDLKKLEREGVDIGIGQNVKAGLVFVTGDNLGSHCLGGFLMSFSKTRYFCRYCTIDNPSFHSDGGHHLKFPARTPEVYNQCLQGRHRNTRMGVKLNSIFNELEHFHVCNPGLPPCLAHDLHEGVAAVDMAWFVYYFICNGWFTTEQLNAKTASFPYSSEDRRDQPKPYTFRAEKIAGGAVQIWTFLKLFPLIVLDLVDDWHEKWEDPVWKNYVLLVEIMELLLAPEFPYVPLRPKHHYLSHAAELIMIFGPLSKVFTLRFEHKHQFFKRTIRFSKNFINVLKSLTVKHELFQAFLRTGAQLQCEVEITNSSTFYVCMYAPEIVHAVQHSVASNHIQECPSVVVRGTTYKKGSLVVLRQAHYQCDVEIGRICLCLYDDNNQVFFVVEVFSTTFVSPTRVFRLEGRKGYECISHSSLLTHCVPREYKVSGSTFVKLKHAIYC